MEGGSSVADQPVGIAGLSGISEINDLPAALKEGLYARLVPRDFFFRLAIDPVTLKGLDGPQAVKITALSGKSWARVEVIAHPEDRDPVLLVDVEMNPLSILELAFVQINNPASSRYGIDRDDEGWDTYFGTAGRNLVEEERALKDGLAPGQVRRGLKLLSKVLEAVERFTVLMGRDLFFIEPLFYHTAVLYERNGCGYLMGKELMEEIHERFGAGGLLTKRLDGSTPFRQPGFERTVRDRSWAIHDGLLDRPWGGVKMYRAVGLNAGKSTCPEIPYR